MAASHGIWRQLYTRDSDNIEPRKKPTGFCFWLAPIFGHCPSLSSRVSFHFQFTDGTPSHKIKILKAACRLASSESIFCYEEESNAEISSEVNVIVVERLLELFINSSAYEGSKMKCFKKVHELEIIGQMLFRRREVLYTRGGSVAPAMYTWQKTMAVWASPGPTLSTYDREEVQISAAQRLLKSRIKTKIALSVASFRGC